MRIIRSVIPFVPLLGCGGSSSGPTAITITTTNPPALLAFRDGPTAAWQTPTGSDPSTFTVKPTGPYQLVVVCDDGKGNIETWRVARTPDDKATFEAPCDPTGVTSHDVMGTMMQAGQVALGFNLGLSSTAPWSFDFSMTDGSYDLIASSTDHVAIRRAVTVAGTTQIMPAIDVVQQGMALVTTPLTISNLAAGETPTARLQLVTPTTFADISHGMPAAAVVIPDSLLVASDIENVEVSADDPTGNAARLVSRKFHQGSPTTFTLPAAMTAIQFPATGGTLGATWTTLPDHDAYDLDAFAFSSDFSTFWFDDNEISASYLAATGDTSATLDTDIPGFKPAWKIDTTKEYTVSFEGFTQNGDDFEAAFVDADVNAPQARAAVRAIRDRRRASR